MYTSAECPGGHCTLVQNVRGDIVYTSAKRPGGQILGGTLYTSAKRLGGQILGGDFVHYDTGLAEKQIDAANAMANAPQLLESLCL